ncbi:hypothetical protein ACIR03_02535 [Clostridium cochlearium]|uniref:hypothetical protein n=1 Tax=Clostridium cochlearium TaxID=1494 RepID=UPI00156DC840|nr:hypothetical protein [Clostridium cochlearium]MBV1816894.1 hypothetical protein [Bacteroidales bacterium MSK.15.36]NSJ90171.1 hypothetical protein [Coprococcus sp. MSK.21.13]MBU5269425.1 hypothetical protein [Clostridium cochlearium]MCG4571741.1 hypothetical protein [Clostridium cochlearium]MCG4579070.1 hypothetical protein [Clostridium cochlearium]
MDNKEVIDQAVKLYFQGGNWQMYLKEESKKRYRLNYYDTELKKNIEVQFETDTENKAINKGKKILDKKKYRNPGLYEMGEGEF